MDRNDWLQSLVTAVLTTAIIGGVSYAMYSYYYSKYGEDVASKLETLSPFLSLFSPKAKTATTKISGNIIAVRET